MTKQVDAVYENGVLRSLEPLTLAENQHVRLTISDTGENGALLGRIRARRDAIRAQKGVLPESSPLIRA